MPAANTDKAKKSKDLFSTTLSTGIGSGDLSLTPNSVSGLATTTAVVLTIDGVNSLGVSTPASREVVVGVVSGGSIVSLIRGVEGTQQAHSAGAVVTEYFTSRHWNDLIDLILTGHRQDGAHKFTQIYDANDLLALELATVASAVSRFKATSAATGNNPSIQAAGEANRGLDLLDSNGNRIYRSTPVAAAANYLDFLNAIAGTAPSVKAAGSDTNIDLKLSPKGTGKINLDGNVQENSIDFSAIRANYAPRNFIASGGIWTQASGLNGDMTAAVLYISGARIALSAVSARAFTASKDTYVDVSSAGAIVYQEVANGAAAPALAANSARVAIVVTSGAAITSVRQFAADSLGNRVYPNSGELGDWWEELGRVSLVAAGDTLTVNPIATRRFLKILFRGQASGLLNPALRFNNDTGNNYNHRVSANATADVTTTPSSGFFFEVGGAAYDFFSTFEMENISGQEKIINGHSSNNTGTGVATLINRRESTGKWTGTATVTRIDGFNQGTGDFAAGAELIVLGHN